MGWSGGTDIAKVMIMSLMELVPDFSIRQKIYTELIEVLTDCDWDVLEEAIGIDDAFDAALKEFDPVYFEE